MCSIMGYCGPVFDLEAFQAGFQRTVSRGPDDSRIVDTGKGLLGFHRLSIMGLTSAGMQPFALDGSFVVCNGEIYGFEKLKKRLEEKYTFASDSDCELLLPLYREYGVEMFRMLDAEFACILYDGERQEYIAARDPIGIRPLYYGYDSQGVILFASEPQNLLGLAAGEILPFPPGHYYKDGRFICYRDMTQVERICRDDLETVCRNIREKLIAGVEKRLVADAKVGFLLSGGLDSSLVCAIAARRSKTPIRTFAIGMSGDAIDLKYAREVAEYIGSRHTEVIITREDVISNLERVIHLLGTYDITTSLARYPTSCSAISIQTTPLLPKRFRRSRKNGSESCTCTMCSGQTGVSRSTPWRHESPSETWSSCAMSCRWTRSGSGTDMERASICSATPSRRAAGCPRISCGGRRRPSPTLWATHWWTT